MISPQSVRTDGRREISHDRTELRITLNQDLVEKLDQLKALLSNKNPHLTDQELIALMADIALKKLDPALKQPRNSSNSLPALAVEGTLQPSLRQPQAKPHTKEAVSGCGKPADQSWFSSTHKAVKATRYIPATIKPLANGGETTVMNLRVIESG